MRVVFRGPANAGCCYRTSICGFCEGQSLHVRILVQSVYGGSVSRVCRGGVHCGGGGRLGALRATFGDGAWYRVFVQQVVHIDVAVWHRGRECRRSFRGGLPAATHCVDRVAACWAGMRPGCFSGVTAPSSCGWRSARAVAWASVWFAVSLLSIAGRALCTEALCDYCMPSPCGCQRCWYPSPVPVVPLTWLRPSFHSWVCW